MVIELYFTLEVRMQFIVSFTRIRSVVIPLNRNEFLGLAGMVTLNDSDNDGFNGIPMADALSVATHDIVDNGKRFYHIIDFILYCLLNIKVNILYTI